MSRSIIKIYGLLILGFSSFGLSAETSRLIDFRLTYARPQFSTPSVHSRTVANAGVDLTYHFFLNRFFAINLGPGAWIVPLRSQTEAIIWYHVFFSTGVTLRPLERTWIDPMVIGQVSVAFSKAGGIFKRQLNYPLSIRGSLNLYKMTNQYEDLHLALIAMGGVSYLMNSPAPMKSWLYDAGIGLRGTF